MPHMDVPHLLGVLAISLAAARIIGGLAKRIGQPSVLGELLAGVFLGASVFGIYDATNETLHLLAEVGVVVLLFEIGMETDLKKLLRVGGAAAAVALFGVVLPFGLGYGTCRLLGLENLVAVVAGATLTATSVGITARVLSELKRLQEPESQIILGAAVIDDVVGLVILAVVAKLTQGEEVTPIGVAQTTAIAFGFLAGVLVVGNFVVPPVARWIGRVQAPGLATTFAIVFTFGLAWLASVSGSAMIIGGFAAGLLMRNTTIAHEVEVGVTSLGHFFVPLFFVSVGAAVNVRTFNPLDAENHRTLLVGGALIVAAIIGKFAAGYAPFWFHGKKHVIGIGMIPRGEVGLIFAQMGLASAVFDSALFSAVTLMVMVTTFIAPPLLKLAFPKLRQKTPKPELSGIAELVAEK